MLTVVDTTWDTSDPQGGALEIALDIAVAAVIEAVIRSYQDYVDSGLTPAQALDVTLRSYVKGDDLGGYQAVADRFHDVTGGKYSRQGILRMWERGLEGKNDFPGKHDYIVVTCRLVTAFDLRETDDWLQQRT